MPDRLKQIPRPMLGFALGTVSAAAVCCCRLIGRVMQQIQQGVDDGVIVIDEDLRKSIGENLRSAATAADRAAEWSCLRDLLGEGGQRNARSARAGA